MSKKYGKCLVATFSLSGHRNILKTGIVKTLFKSLGRAIERWKLKMGCEKIEPFYALNKGNKTQVESVQPGKTSDLNL